MTVIVNAVVLLLLAGLIWRVVAEFRSRYDDDFAAREPGCDNNRGEK